MSYDESDAQRDAYYDELYEEIRVEVAREGAHEGLRIYYINNPDVMRPAFGAYSEGQKLLAAHHYAAAMVFFVTSMEQFLKAVLLKPVVCGLVKHAGLADVIAKIVLDGNSGFDRYSKLLSDIFMELSGLPIRSFSLPGSQEKLLTQCDAIQKIRNGIVHRGETCTLEQAELAGHVANGVREHIVDPILRSLRLKTTPTFQIVSKS